MSPQAIKISSLWATLSALLIGTLVGTMGNSIVSIALPSLMEYYSIPLTSAAWAITLYTLTFSVLIPVFGSLSRAIGFKRLFTAGMALTAVSSFICIIAPNFLLFLLARILIGIGVATILPVIMGVISHYFPAEMQGRATGYWAFVNSLGHAIGPPVGGFLLSYFSWQAIFWINIPLAIIAIVAAVKVFPRDELIPNPSFDWSGAAAMTTLVFSTMLGISQAAKVGLGASATITLFMVAFISFAFLLWRERRTASPFIDPALFARKDYLASIVPISLQAFTQFGLLVSLPVFLIDANGIEKQVAGLLIMSMTVMMAITSPFAGRLIDRYSSRWLCLAGTLLIGIGALLMFSQHSPAAAGVNWLPFILSLVIFGVGFGSIQSGSTVAAIQASPKEMTGSATGFFHMLRFLMASLGSTVFGILFEGGVKNELSGFYSSFLLIIVLALITVPFTFWISSKRNGQIAARQLA